MTISYADFRATVELNAGQLLVTSGGRATFWLFRDEKRVGFQPSSSGQLREINESAIQRYLDVFNQTGSTKTSDYTDKMRNASYVLTIIKLWLGQQNDAPLIDDGTNELGEIDTEFCASEGEPKIRMHRYRERSRFLVEIAKELFRATHENRLFCEVCDFDFGRAYDAPDFIEAHHRTPLRDLRPGEKTKISDLAMVCANCHRMLHRGIQWPTITQLRERVLANAKVGAGARNL